MADNLSRGRINKFKEVAKSKGPMIGKDPENIPDFLWPASKLWSKSMDNKTKGGQKKSNQSASKSKI